MAEERVGQVRRLTHPLDASVGLVDHLGKGRRNEVGQLRGLEAGPQALDRNKATATNVRVLRHPYLRPMQPPGPPRRLHGGRPFLIGRLPSCNLVLDQPAISRRHAVIYQGDRGWYIADAGSSNGAHVNLVPAVEPVRLIDGDEIRLGESVMLRFELRPQHRRSR